MFYNTVRELWETRDRIFTALGSWVLEQQKWIDLGIIFIIIVCINPTEKSCCGGLKRSKIYSTGIMFMPIQGLQQGGTRIKILYIPREFTKANKFKDIHNVSQFLKFKLPYQLHIPECISTKNARHNTWKLEMPQPKKNSKTKKKEINSIFVLTIQFKSILTVVN